MPDTADFPSNKVNQGYYSSKFECYKEIDADNKYGTIKEKEDWNACWNYIYDAINGYLLEIGNQTGWNPSTYTPYLKLKYDAIQKTWVQVP